MALTRILLWLGNSFVLCAVLMAITSFSAVILLEFDEALRFAFLTVTIGVVGVVFIITTRKTPARESNSDALAFLLLFWLIMPVLFALPYMASQVTPSFATAYFEAVSAVTTTGASTLKAESLSSSLLIWRSLLQWIGGVSAATFAVVILSALNLSGTGVHRSRLFTLKTGELFERLIGIGRIVFMVYAVLSGLCFVALVITGTPAFDALCLSLTSVSTGGLTPRDGPMAAYVGPTSAMVLAIFCLTGAFSIAVLWDMFRKPERQNQLDLVRNVEHRGVFVITGGLIMIGLFYSGPLQIGTLLPEAIFFASSTGYDYQVIGIEMLPPAILIAVALVGGAALSTTGGVKIIRVILLLRHLFTDLSRLPHPSRALPITFKGRVIPDTAFLSVWMYFLGYTLALSGGIVALGAAGLPLETSVAASAASLANMGPLLSATMTGTEFPDFTVSQQMISAVIMLLGRVEVLTVFAAIFGVIAQRR